jgi:putative membrane protein
VTFSEVGAVLWLIVGGLILLTWIIAVPIMILWIKNLSYYIEDERITIYKGILNKTQQNIPYRAVTDFLLRRSLFDRFLGIGAIRIQTAGQSHAGNGYEGNLLGLVEYDDLHKQLRTKIKNLHPLSESIGVAEDATPLSHQDKLHQILEELREIRKVLEKK